MGSLTEWVDDRLKVLGSSITTELKAYFDQKVTEVEVAVGNDIEAMPAAVEKIVEGLPSQFVGLMNGTLPDLLENVLKGLLPHIPFTVEPPPQEDSPT